MTRGLRSRKTDELLVEQGVYDRSIRIMWRDGYDTNDMARAMSVEMDSMIPEGVVANRLAAIRDYRHRKSPGAAA